jgi:exopolysaccharide biosynthesis polyprenyl glycosylphosphotransferase
MTVVPERLTRPVATPGTRWTPALVSVGALAVDTLAVALSGLIAVIGRERTMLFDQQTEIQSTLGLAGPLVLVGWIAVVFLVGGYRRDVFGAGADEYKRVARASLYAAALLGIGCYLTKFSLSRGFFLLLFAVGVPALLLGRYVWRKSIHAARSRGALAQQVLITGAPSHVDEIAGVLRRQPWLGYSVVGALTPATDLEEETPGGIPVLGNVDDIALAVRNDVDVVFFAGGAHTSGSELRRAIYELEHTAVQLVVAPSVSGISEDRVQLRPVGGLPLVHIDPPRWTDASRLGKRTFDLVGALALLVLTAPVLLVAGAWVKLHDHGPVLFRQRRVGRDGATFDCFKFRSMVTDAELRLAALHAEQGYDGTGLFKMKQDPRITTPGRLLRRLSIDELPQLWNVVRGEMSLVGPRPPLPTEVQGYDEHVARRLHVRPGLTGLWQVSGRSDLSFDEAIRLDIYYVDNWSMLQDLQILCRTLGAVLGSRGAY